VNRPFHEIAKRLRAQGMKEKDINMALAMVYLRMKVWTAMRKFHQEEAKARDRRAIERAYQRAMDIRDTTLGFLLDPAVEEQYGREYRSRFHRHDAKGFRPCTRRYLKKLRAAEIS
jgi:hypothetical protein